jgi:enolase-phosphatase E1
VPRFSLSAAGIAVVLCDIEGTTTPIAFVHDVLFPYARARIESFLNEHANDPEVRAIVDALRAEQQSSPGPRAPSPEPRPFDVAQGRPEPVEGRAPDPIAYIHHLMDRDRKSGPLKALQGRIWEYGYASGELRGEVYADVPGAFARWTAAGLRVAIFSSGSVLAQKLIFGRSTAGDLTRYLSAYFDTGVGAKGDADSYRRIVDALGVPAVRVLFLSDVVSELVAAHAAGLHALLSVRPPAPAPDAPTFDVITTFDAIAP